MTAYFQERGITLYCGDCLDVLRSLPDCSIHAVITDPPSGIGFMGKDWDKNRGGRDRWIEWLEIRMAEVLRVLVPGGHGLVWALPRTSHWTGMAIENAGFEVRDRVSHFFGQGWPKGGGSSAIGLRIDKDLGVESKVVGDNPNHRAKSGVEYQGIYAGGNTGAAKVRAPVSDLGKAWDGWSSSLKPACEDWWLIRKPFRGAIFRNVVKHGTGAINVDACRIPTGEKLTRKLGKTTESPSGWRSVNRSEVAGKDGGRWPAHITFSHSPECQVIGQKQVKGDNRGKQDGKRPGGFGDVGHDSGDGKPCGQLYGDSVVDVWECQEGCAVAALDEQSGVLKSGDAPNGLKRNSDKHRNTYSSFRGQDTESCTLYGDAGGASRFFYCAKPSPKEKNAGGDNDHPTVKPRKLMQWLARMVTPPRGVVLDPFMGSGTTGVACMLEGFRFIGIEENHQYVQLSKSRILAAEDEVFE